MRVTHYTESDYLYLDLAPAKSAESAEIADGVVLDFGADGAIVGIEIARASERIDIASIPGVTVIRTATKTERAIPAAV
jgi:uncharacterized protein YuzE